MDCSCPISANACAGRCPLGKGIWCCAPAGRPPPEMPDGPQPVIDLAQSLSQSTVCVRSLQGGSQNVAAPIAHSRNHLMACQPRCQPPACRLAPLPPASELPPEIGDGRGAVTEMERR